MAAKKKTATKAKPVAKMELVFDENDVKKHASNILKNYLGDMGHRHYGRAIPPEVKKAIHARLKEEINQLPDEDWRKLARKILFDGYR